MATSDAVAKYFSELRYFAKEARAITGSPMKKHMRVAVKSHAEYFTRKLYPQFSRIVEGTRRCSQQK